MATTLWSSVSSATWTPWTSWHPSVTIATGVVVGCVYYSWRKWRHHIRRHVQRVQEEAGKLVMTRRPLDLEASSSPLTSKRKRSRLAAQLDLSDQYKAYLRKNYPDLRVASLGEYLDSLQPGVADLVPQEELDILLGAALIRVMGPRFGGALVPAVGLIPPEWVAKVSSLATVTTSLASSQQEQDAAAVNKPTLVATVAEALPSLTVGALSGLSLFSLLGVADVAFAMSSHNKKAAEKQPEASVAHKSPIDQILTHGELQSGTTFAEELIPNPFILSQHFEKAVLGLEAELRQQQQTQEDGQTTWDPDTYSSPEPTNAQEVLLPDLCIGAGGVKCTHTNRQIVQNRLVSLLLNRLMANYLPNEFPTSKPFQVQMDPTSQAVRHPSSLVEELVRAGYQVKARTASRITTFGFALSVKEQVGSSSDDKDFKWVHIPLALPLRSGISTLDGSPIPGYLTHSCNDLSISGPLMQGVLVEGYLNIDGFAGWISGHYHNLPWMYGAVSKEIDAVRSIEISSLLFVSINSVAEKLHLMNGGYGMIGVCNDSAAIVDATTRGSTFVYPLCAIGSYANLLVNRVAKLIEELKAMDGIPKRALVEAKRLYKTLLDEIPNDVHPLPRDFPDTGRRMKESMPELPFFADMEESFRALSELALGG